MQGFAYLLRSSYQEMLEGLNNQQKQ
jgi:hypothetical protein